MRFLWPRWSRSSRPKLAEGLADFERCRDFAHQHRPIDMGAILQLEGTEALLHVMSGRTATADRLLARARTDGPRLAAAGDETSALMIALTSATRGEWADVVTWARRACDSLTVTDSGGFRRMALTALAAGLAGTGQRDAARGALLEAESVNRVNLGLEPFTRGQVVRAKFLLADSDVADYTRTSLQLAHDGGFVLLDPFFRLALGAWDADVVDKDFVAQDPGLGDCPGERTVWGPEPRPCCMRRRPHGAPPHPTWEPVGHFVHSMGAGYHLQVARGHPPG